MTAPPSKTFGETARHNKKEREDINMKKKISKIVCDICQEIIQVFSLVIVLVFSIFNVQANDKEHKKQ